MASTSLIEGSLGVSGGTAKIAGTLGALAIQQAGDVETAAQTAITAPAVSLTDGSLAVKHTLQAAIDASGGDLTVEAQITGKVDVNGAAAITVKTGAKIDGGVNFDDLLKNVKVSGTLTQQSSVAKITYPKYKVGSLVLDGSSGDVSSNYSKFTVGDNPWKLSSNGTMDSTPSVFVYKKKENNVELTFNYAQTFDVKKNYTYYIECYGAKGGLSGENSTKDRAKGGKASGTLKISDDRKLYIHVGQRGNDSYYNPSNSKYPAIGGAATYGGGGKGGDGGLYSKTTYSGGGSGGGASFISLSDGAWDNWAVAKDRIMVAGGGGGDAGRHAYGSAGGGKESSYTTATNSVKTVKGSSQSEGYSFGGFGRQGFKGIAKDYSAEGDGGGGGGYWTGYSGYLPDSKSGTYQNCGGSGGSGYVSGFSGCKSVSSGSTGFNNAATTNTEHHFSGVSFTAPNLALITEGNSDYDDGRVTIKLMETE
jgi:hypothetical protein